VGLPGSQIRLEAARQQRRFAAIRPREKAKSLVFGRFRVTDEVDYFRMADDPLSIRFGYFYRDGAIRQRA
jgi:hypothetical protein